MWSCIRITGTLDRLETALFRSRSYPLCIYYSESSDWNAQLWDVLLDHCDHWRTIEIHVSTEEFVHRLPKPQRHALTLLERFHLYSEFQVLWRREQFDESVLDALATAPRLHGIFADHFRFPSNSPFTLVPADKNPFLIADIPKMTSIFYAKHQTCNNYTSATIRTISAYPPPLFIHHCANCMHLRSRLCRVSPFPALKMLSTAMCPIKGNSPSQSPIVHEFIVRCRCTLREMHLMTVDMDQSFIDLLKDSPTVEVLHLSFKLSELPSAIDVFSKSLTYPEADKSIFDAALPRLTNLRMNFTSLPISHAFVTMVRSRWYVDPTRATQLRRLTCYGCAIVSAVNTELLRQIYGEGLQLDISLLGGVTLIGSSFDD